MMEQLRTRLAGRVCDVLESFGVSATDARRLSSAGRMNRGAIVAVLGRGVEDSIDVAAGVELLHRASVIHDDIQDGDQTRRGRPTEHSVVGVDVALGISDLCIFAGTELASSRGRYWEDVVRSMTTVAVGQYQDIHGTWNELAPAPDSVAEKKTGSFVKLCFILGARLGGYSCRDVQTIGNIGLALGTAFQISNDIRNTKNMEDRGGNGSNDLRLQRRTSITLRHFQGQPLEVAVENALDAVNRLKQQARTMANTLHSPVPLELFELIDGSKSGEEFVGDQEALNQSDSAAEGRSEPS